jgi:hypothetical protein
MIPPLLFLLEKIAGGDFLGHRLRSRRQKAWLLPAAQCHTPAAIFSDIGFVPAGKRRGFCRLLIPADDRP